MKKYIPLILSILSLVVAIATCCKKAKADFKVSGGTDFISRTANQEKSQNVDGRANLGYNLGINDRSSIGLIGSMSTAQSYRSVLSLDTKVLDDKLTFKLGPSYSHYVVDKTAGLGANVGVEFDMFNKLYIDFSLNLTSVNDSSETSSFFGLGKRF